MAIYIPTIGIGQLFDLNQHRLLSLTILAPLLFRKWENYKITGARRLNSMDWAILLFGVLQIILPMSYESTTNTLRRALLFTLDTFIVFYLFSRLETSSKVIREILATFCLVCVILASIATFESLKGWLLYTGLGDLWGAPNTFAFLLRGESLRAQASTGHSLALSYHVAIGFGFWLYLGRFEPNLVKKFSVLTLLLAGVIVSYSRGGLVSAILLYVLFIAFRPDAGRYLVRALPITIAVVVGAYLSPLKESVIDRLPLIGVSDQGTIDYRQQVAELSWKVIKLNPYFGDPFASSNLLELRQGQGIIDIVNGYAFVALFNGLVGLALFLLPFLIAIFITYRAFRKHRFANSDDAVLCATLLACLLATMFFIATAGTEPAVYWLMGLMVCCARVFNDASSSNPVANAKVSW